MSNVANQWEEMFNEDGGNGGSKAEFVKLPEGITKLRIVDAIPTPRWTHWMPQFKRSVACPGKGCPICNIRKNQKANGETQTYSMQKKFALNVINRTTGQVEILDQGKTFMDDLKFLVTDEGDPREYDIKVRRTGKNTDTKYRIDLDKKEPLSDADKQLVEHARVDFNEYFKAPTNEQLIDLLNGGDWNDVMKSNSESDTNEGSFTVK